MNHTTFDLSVRLCAGVLIFISTFAQVRYHHLRPKDKFLILATDGLWNMFPNNENKVVQLVADHMVGAQTISDFRLPKDRPLQLGELNEFLKIRKVNRTYTCMTNGLASLGQSAQHHRYSFTRTSGMMIGCLPYCWTHAHLLQR